MSEGPWSRALEQSPGASVPHSYAVGRLHYSRVLDTIGPEGTQNRRDIEAASRIHMRGTQKANWKASNDKSIELVRVKTMSGISEWRMVRVKTMSGILELP